MLVGWACGLLGWDYSEVALWAGLEVERACELGLQWSVLVGWASSGACSLLKWAGLAVECACGLAVKRACGLAVERACGLGFQWSMVGG